VTLVAHRDPAVLRDGLTRWFAARRDAPGARIDTLEHASVGYSSETVLVDVSWDAPEGSRSESLVVRMAPATVGTFADYDLTVQARAQEIAARAGVPVATPFAVETDPIWLGDPFAVMPRVRGHIVGESVAHDRWIASLEPARQRSLHTNFVDALARIHRADWQRSDPDELVPRRDLAAELDRWARYLDWSSSGEPLPALVEALAWCRAHAPEDDDGGDGRGVLLWGDVRLGNVVVGDDLAVRAVLDWDMTSIGRPEHDVAWLTTLESTMGELTGRQVPGFLDRAGVVAHYERAAGRTLRNFDWYETFALVRSTAIMVRIGMLRRRAGDPSRSLIEENPIVPLLFRRMRE
jgi:aminoglycoside phosphotransferase (APT) family kinase protein